MACLGYFSTGSTPCQIFQMAFPRSVIVFPRPGTGKHSDTRVLSLVCLPALYIFIYIFSYEFFFFQAAMSLTVSLATAWLCRSLGLKRSGNDPCRSLPKFAERELRHTGGLRGPLHQPNVLLRTVSTHVT